MDSLSHMILLVFSSSLIITSILCLALKSAAINGYNTATGHGQSYSSVVLEDEFPDQQLLLANYPLNLDFVTTRSLFVAAGLSLVSGVIALGLTVRSLVKRRALQLVWYQRRILTLLLVVNTSVATAVMVFINVDHSKSTHFSINYRTLVDTFGPGDRYNEGVFDLESWTCVVMDLASFKGNDWNLKGQCMMESGSRACSTLLVVFAAAVATVMWWDSRYEKKVVAHLAGMDRDEELSYELCRDHFERRGMKFDDR